MSQSFFSIVGEQLRAILKNRAVTAVMLGALLVYAVLYPMPYSRQVVLAQPIVVVDLDHSQLSRRLIRQLHASPAAAIVASAQSIEAAQQLLTEARADSFYDDKMQLRGFMVIPRHFERDALLGISPTLNFSGDASAFLSYGTIINAMLQSATALATDLRGLRLIQAGAEIDAANADVAPLSSRPLYNHDMTYLNYILPAVFIFILHQLLLMSAALHGSWQRLECGADNLQGAMLFKVLWARALVFSTLFSFGVLFYFGISFKYYAVPVSGSALAWLMLFVPLLLSCSMLGALIGQIIPQPQYAPALLLLSAAPLLFGTGFIWPLELVPKILVAPLELVPSTAAIHGFLKLSQMQGDLQSIAIECAKLWGLSIFYLLLTLLVGARKSKARS